MSELTVRQRRVGDLIARELSLVMQQCAADPGLAGAVITGVRVSGDLRQATVYVTTVVSTERSTLMSALTRSEAFLRRELTERVQLRHAPTLTFRLDETYDRAHRIEDLLDELVKGGLEPAADDAIEEDEQ